MSTAPLLCRDCGQTIVQQEEKAIGEPRDRAYQIVWADWQGNWVCFVTGDEHEPGEPRRSVEVTVKFGDRESVIRLSPAEAGNFMFNPITLAVTHGDPAEHTQEAYPERFATIEEWSRGLYRLLGLDVDA